MVGEVCMFPKENNMVTIVPTFYVKGVSLETIYNKFRSGGYAKMSDVPRGVKTQGTSKIQVAKTYSQNLHDDVSTLKDKNGSKLIIATTNHPQFEVYRSGSVVGDVKEVGGRCRSCMEDFTCEGVGKIYAGREVITAYVPSVSPPGVWEASECILRGSGTSTSFPGGPCVPAPLDKKWTFNPVADPTLPAKGRSVKKYAFWQGEPLCSFECSLEYLRRTNKHDDIAYIESEMLLRLLFSLCYPEEKTLIPAPNPELYDARGGKSALKKEEYKMKKHRYIPSPLIIMIPAKVPYMRQDA